MLVSKCQADSWHLKVGDTFTVIAPVQKKADGTTNWTFKVVAIDARHRLHDGNGYMLGNYDYMDKARPLADQGKTGGLPHQAQRSQPDRRHRPADRRQVRQFRHPAAIHHRKGGLSTYSNTGMDIASVDREIALAGMFMVLFLTANGIAQAVRERFAEFATLKTIGFSDARRDRAGVRRGRHSLSAGRGLGVGLADGAGRASCRALMPPGHGRAHAAP